MLQTVLETLLSLLAVFGLFSLSWLLFGRLLSPLECGAPVYAVIPARGSGGALEQTVRGLLWLKAGKPGRYTVLIADIGLDAEGLSVAAALSNRDPRVIVCPMESLTEYLME